MSERAQGVAQPQRVLVVAPTCRQVVTGVGVCVEALIDSLERREWDVRVIDVGTSMRGTPVGSFAFTKLGYQLWCVVRVLLGLRRSQVVYLTLSSSRFGALRDCAVILVSRFSRRPVVGHLHGGGFRSMFDSSPPLFRRLLKWCLNRLDCVIVLTPSLRSQYLGIVAAEIIAVVPNGAAAPLSDAMVEKKLSSHPERPLTLLYLSNLIPSKGYREAIDATRIIRARRGDVVRLKLGGEFMTVADGTGASRNLFIDRMLQDIRGDGDAIRYEGPVSGERKQQMFEDAAILLLPTYYPWEGQPVCILEAMASGIAVITTSHKGIPDTVVDGTEGIVLDAADPERIAAEAIRLLDDPDRRVAIARAARKRYERDYSLEKNNERLVSILMSALERQGHRRRDVMSDS